MTAPNEEALELAAVKAQFVEAEKRLRDLAQGAVDLTRASVVLKKARMGLAESSEGLRDLSGKLSEYIDSVAALTNQLRQSMLTLQNAGGGYGDQLAALESRLDDIQRALAKHPTSTDQGAIAASTLASTVERLGSISEELAQRAGGMEEATRKVSELPDLGSLRLLPELAQETTRMRSLIEAAGLDALAERLDSIGRAVSGTSPATTLESFARLEQTVVRLERSVAEFSKLAQAVPSTTQSPALPPGFLALEQGVAELQNDIERMRRRVRFSEGGTTGPTEIQPEIHDSLMALAREMHAKEVAMVDTLAELRRSMGRDLDRRQSDLDVRLERESEVLRQRLDRVRKALWILAATVVVAAGLLALLLF